VDEVIKALALEEVKGRSLLVGEFGEGLTETGLVVGRELEEPTGFGKVLLGLSEVLNLRKKALIGHDHAEVGAPGKSHARVLDRAGE